MERFHGIQFDIARAEPTTFGYGRHPDINNDGTNDPAGVLASDKINHYAVGLHEFYRGMRNALGPNRLIMADGGEDISQRSADLLNGMETEGFAGPGGDPYLKEWSSNLNRFRYWQGARQQVHEFNYVVHKDNQSTNVLTNIVRQVLATAQALGVGVCYTIEPPHPFGDVGIWDELRCGTSNILHWLGQPRGPMLRLATNSTDLLGGKGVTMQTNFVSAWASANASVTNDAGTLRITRKPAATTNLTLALPLASLTPAPTLPGGDLFFRFEIQADPLTGYDTNWPRKLSVTVTNRQMSTNTADELFALAGPAGFTEVAFYFRNAGYTATPIINLQLEGTNSAAIRNFTIHNAADRIAREFENGVVLINPSMSGASFDLAALFPGRSFRRLAGVANQDPVTNDGTPVGATVSVPPRDGLFLKTVPGPGISTLVHGGGTFRLLITGDAGLNFTVETSPDLLDWRALQTTNPPTTPFFWLDTGASSFPARFYRVILGP